MPAPKFIDIDGKRFLWRDLVQRRREQVAAAKVEQPVLFEMKDDSRPAFERTAAGRYSEPTLFLFTERGIGLPRYPPESDDRSAFRCAAKMLTSSPSALNMSQSPDPAPATNYAILSRKFN